MQPFNHGGSCCGIKEIKGFHKRQRQTFPATNCFEKQTALNRLKTIIQRQTDMQKAGLLSVVLADERIFWRSGGVNRYTSIYDEWHKTIEKLGFKEVNRFRNSNTGNMCYVFHLAYGQDKKAATSSPF